MNVGRSCDGAAPCRTGGLDETLQNKPRRPSATVLTLPPRAGRPFPRRNGLPARERVPPWRPRRPIFDDLRSKIPWRKLPGRDERLPGRDGGPRGRDGSSPSGAEAGGRAAGPLAHGRSDSSRFAGAVRSGPRHLRISGRELGPARQRCWRGSSPGRPGSGRTGVGRDRWRAVAPGAGTTSGRSGDGRRPRWASPT